MPNPLKWLKRYPWVPVILAVLVVFGLWANGTRTQSHQLRAVFSDAPSLYSGLDVRVNGLDAGKVTSVKHEDGQAVIGVGIDDDRFWPLTQGTTVEIRYGTTIGNGTRIIELTPGPEGGAELPENGIIENKNTIEAVEFDDLFDTADETTRANMQGAFKAMGNTFGDRQPSLRAGIDEAGPGLEEVSDLATELTRDTVALRSVIENGNQVMTALASSREGIKNTITNAAGTFDTFATNAENLQLSIERFPDTLREMRTTLTRMRPTIGHLDALVTDLGPGARELGPLSRDLQPALQEMRAVAPLAINTLRSTQQSAPRVTPLLRQLTPFSKDARPALRGLSPIFHCLRPYAPEIAGQMTAWASMANLYDGEGHGARLIGNAGPTSPTSVPPVNSGDFTAATGQQYALLRPPGFNAGDPHYMPECGITPDGVDASKDPEDG